MSEYLHDYILSEANTDWVADLLTSGDAEDALCSFVERMVIDALMDSQVALMYLKEDTSV